MSGSIQKFMELLKKGNNIDLIPYLFETLDSCEECERLWNLLKGDNNNIDAAKKLLVLFKEANGDPDIKEGELINFLGRLFNLVKNCYIYDDDYDDDDYSRVDPLPEGTDYTLFSSPNDAKNIIPVVVVVENHPDNEYDSLLLDNTDEKGSVSIPSDDAEKKGSDYILTGGCLDNSDQAE